MQLLRGARRKTARPNLSRPRTQNRPRLPGALHAGRRNLFHGLKRDFIGTPQVPPQLPKVFAEYIELLEDGGAANQPQLAKRLKANSKRAAEIMTKEMTERLEAYMPTLLALEVIGEQFLHCLFLYCLSPLSLLITALCFVNRSERIER